MMAIDGINNNSKPQPVPLVPHRANGNHGAASSRKVQDQSQFSDRSLEFQRIRELVDALPDVRLDRVNRLSQAIDSGTYNVRGDQIAEALIEKHLIDFEA